MALRKTDVEQLIARLGHDNVLTSEADRLVYSTDMGSPPGIVDLLVRRRADAVVRCHDIGDVETAVRFCLRRRIPMTPRAAATSALGGAVPKRAGVVLDLTPMSRRLDIDEAVMTVTVDAGVVIRDLREKLAEVGLELPVYPTSGNAATIGGFVAMDGHGIGATRHGNIGKHVLEVEGVGMDGGRFAARDRDRLDMLLGLGGSTGILTTIKLRVVEATPDKPVAVALKRYSELQAFIEEATATFTPKHVMFHNADFFTLRNEATGQKKDPFAGRHGVILCFSETEHGAVADKLARMAERHGGEILDDKTAQAEWEGRLFPIRAKRLGPSLVAGEVFVPLEKAAAYLRRLKTKVAVKELSVEGHVTDDGRVYFFLFTLDDERRATYPLGWGTSARILHTAKRSGGRAYHCGVWLQFQARDVFGPQRYKALKTLKRNGDPRLLWNPGMVFPLPVPVPEFIHKMPVSGPAPLPSLGLQLAAGDPLLILQDKMVRYQRHKSLGVEAADVAADMARGGDLGLHSEFLWGVDLASAQAIPDPGRLPMTQTVRGKLVLAKAFVQSKINDPWALKAALDVADPDPADVKALCPEIDDILPVLEALRKAVQAEGVTLEVKTVEVAEEAVPEVGAVTAGPAGKEGLDIEAIRKQAKATPEDRKAWVVAADCIVCNGCEAACPTGAAIVTDVARVDRDLCIADGACFDACPTGAIRPGIEDSATTSGWPEGSRLAKA